MSALLFASAIGTLLGFNGRLFSWVFGGLLIAATIFLALLVFGISPRTLTLAGLSVLGYNLGLSTAVGFALLTQKRTAT